MYQKGNSKNLPHFLFLLQPLFHVSLHELLSLQVRDID